MRCPRCGNDWDTKKGSCTVCGLVVRIPRQEPVQNAFTPSLRDVSPGTFSEAEQHITPASLNPSQTIFTLEPGTLLHQGRYRLHQMLGRRYWLPGMYEANWIAHNVQHGGLQVVIREVGLPEDVALPMQTALRATALSFASVGRNTHLPTLLDTFSERGRNFFVFAPIEGESLLSRMRRTGRSLAETEIIEICLQMTEVLELFSQQSPPLVHGLISPESIVIGRSENEYILTSFSLVLTSGAARLIAKIDRNKLSPYTAPECIRGFIDVRSDMYSVLATAYYAVTRNIPVPVNGSIPSAQHINPSISAQLDAILARGLHSDIQQRYQYPFELRQELLAIRNGSSGTFDIVGIASNQGIAKPLTPPIAEEQRMKITPASTSIDDTVAQIFQSLAPDDDRQKYKTQLPHPEQLPPIPEQNYKMQASIWITSIVVCLLMLVIIGRGLW